MTSAKHSKTPRRLGRLLPSFLTKTTLEIIRKRQKSGSTKIVTILANPVKEVVR